MENQIKAQLSENIYEKNETMKLLGQQSPIIYLNRKEQICDILNARNVISDHDLLCDVFILGFINGKREERKRKRTAANIKEPVLELFSKLSRSDYKIKKQIYAILYRYLEKRDNEQRTENIKGRYEII